jgi:hypothetical protein
MAISYVVTYIKLRWLPSIGYATTIIEMYIIIHQLSVMYQFQRLQILYCSVILSVRQRLLLCSEQNSGIDTPCICTYHKFRPTEAIIRYIELLQSPFLLSALPPCTDQCLHIGSAFYRYVVYVMPLCYKMHYILECLKILKYSNWNKNWVMC